MGKSEAASILVGFIFSPGLAGNAESDSVVLGEAVGQIQHALPKSAGRAWLRESSLLFCCFTRQGEHVGVLKHLGGAVMAHKHNVPTKETPMQFPRDPI